MFSRMTWKVWSSQHVGQTTQSSETLVNIALGPTKPHPPYLVEHISIDISDIPSRLFWTLEVISYITTRLIFCLVVLLRQGEDDLGSCSVFERKDGFQGFFVDAALFSEPVTKDISDKEE